MEILYVRETGRIVAIKPDGSPWGAGEVSEGHGVGPFGLLRRVSPLPDVPRDCLRVRGTRVEVVALPADPRPEV